MPQLVTLRPGGDCHQADERFCSSKVPYGTGCTSLGGDEFECKCMYGFERQGKNRQSKCLLDECKDNNGGCDANASCSNRLEGPSCKCKEPNWTEGGGSFPGEVCVVSFCADKKLNDCDPHFATCTLNEGSYVCKCKPGLKGDGTKDFCKVARGFTSNVYCEILGNPCNEYQDCKRVVSASGSYECFDKSGADQIAVFFGSGPSSDTPGWVLAVVIIGCILLFGGGGFLAFWAYKRAKREDIGDEMMAAALNAQQYDYGATGPPPPLPLATPPMPA